MSDLKNFGVLTFLLPIFLWMGSVVQTLRLQCCMTFGVNYECFWDYYRRFCTGSLGNMQTGWALCKVWISEAWLSWFEKRDVYSLVPMNIMNYTMAIKYSSSLSSSYRHKWCVYFNFFIIIVTCQKLQSNNEQNVQAACFVMFVISTDQCSHIVNIQYIYIYIL